MKYLNFSKCLQNRIGLPNIPDDVLKEPVIQPIYMIQQFFISDNKERQKEINFCLKENVKNKLFTKIILINEKIYTKEELGIDDLSNVIQVDIKRRMMFSDVFMAVKKMGLNGYIVFCNSDIIFDPSIKRLYYSTMLQRPVVQCLARYDIRSLNKDLTFNYRLNLDKHGSHDTWILHSKFIPQDKYLLKFNFNFGTWACDNHILYLFYILNYLPKNEYKKYKTYHYHKSNYRTYNPVNVFGNNVLGFIKE